MITTVLLVAHVAICLAVIGLVLIQHGKGADAGAAFGSGASGTVFGSRGSASFLSRTTALLAAGFFVTSIVLAMLAGTYSSGGSVIVDGTGNLIRIKDEADEGGGAQAPAAEPAPESESGQPAPAPGGDTGAADGPAPPPAGGQ